MAYARFVRDFESAHKTRRLAERVLYCSPYTCADKPLQKFCQCTLGNGIHMLAPLA